MWLKNVCRIINMLVCLVLLIGCNNNDVIKEYEDEIVKLEGELSSVKIINQNEKSNNDYLELTVQKLKEENDEITTLLEIKEDTVNYLKTEINEVNQVNKQLSDEIDSFSKSWEESDPNYFLRLKEEEYDNFNLRERYILNRWNQLANLKTGYDFWGVKIGQELFEVVGNSKSTFECNYEFSDNSIGDEGIYIKKDFMEIRFIGTRVKAIIVDYSKTGDDRYVTNDLEVLLSRVKEDYPYHKVEVESADGSSIILRDDVNGIEIRFVYLNNGLFIHVEHIEEF